MSTISGGSKPEFTGNEVLQASKLNLATHHWVATEVPDDSVGRDGDIVFVPGDSAPNSELPGIGGWATIEEVSGTFTKHPYNDGELDWFAYEWTDDGSLTISEGLVDALIVGAGGNSITVATDQLGPGGRAMAGDGGDVVPGLWECPDGTHDVVVGQANDTTTGGSPGGPSSITFISLTALGGKNNGVNAAGSGATEQRTIHGNGGKGYVSSITGDPVEYSRGGWMDEMHSQSATERFESVGTHGWGGSANPYHNGSGTSVAGYQATGGVVIIRVPAANAQNVTENYFRFIHHATVEDGVVTKVTKTPDNLPYKTAVDEVECNPSVQVGYTYDEKKNTFVAPTPDYSDEIAALTERLEELRNV